LEPVPPLEQELFLRAARDLDVVAPVAWEMASKHSQSWDSVPSHLRWMLTDGTLHTEFLLALLFAMAENLESIAIPPNWLIHVPFTSWEKDQKAQRALQAYKPFSSKHVPVLSRVKRVHLLGNGCGKSSTTRSFGQQFDAPAMVPNLQLARLGGFYCHDPGLPLRHLTSLRLKSFESRSLSAVQNLMHDLNNAGNSGLRELICEFANGTAKANIGSLIPVAAGVRRLVLTIDNKNTQDDPEGVVHSGMLREFSGLESLSLNFGCLRYVADLKGVVKTTADLAGIIPPTVQHFTLHFGQSAADFHIPWEILTWLSPDDGTPELGIALVTTPDLLALAAALRTSGSSSLKSVSLIYGGYEGNSSTISRWYRDRAVIKKRFAEVGVKFKVIVGRSKDFA
jgi:hypothetical protein